MNKNHSKNRSSVSDRRQLEGVELYCTIDVMSPVATAWPPVNTLTIQLVKNMLN